MLKETDVVIVVDYQNDFLPGGSLGVTDGDKIAVAINRVIQANNFNIATKDFHPENHCSFGNPPQFKDKSWPVHCVAGTKGAELSDKLFTKYIHCQVSKGQDATKEAYSGFEGTELASLLEEYRTKRVFICGIATDYCVKATALDAVKLGYETIVLTDAIKEVALESGIAALKEMEAAGCKVATTLEVISHE